MAARNDFDKSSKSELKQVFCPEKSKVKDIKTLHSTEGNCNPPMESGAGGGGGGS